LWSQVVVEVQTLLALYRAAAVALVDSAPQQDYPLLLVQHTLLLWAQAVMAVAQRQLTVQIQYFLQLHPLVAVAVANEVLMDSQVVQAVAVEMTAILVALALRGKVLLEEMVLYPVMVLVEEVVLALLAQPLPIMLVERVVLELHLLFRVLLFTMLVAALVLLQIQQMWLALLAEVVVEPHIQAV
jgi:hypothetical protein